MTTMLRLDRRPFLVQSALAGAALLVPRRVAWAAGPSDPVVETASGKIRGAGGPAAAQRIPDPDTGKPSRFDLAGKIGDAIHQSALGIRPGVDPDHRAYAH